MIKEFNIIEERFLMLPSASDLGFFIEVANTNNMSRAAERLGVTQPALSQGMKRLEHAFDQQLLLRGKGGVTLTKAGEKLALNARKLLEDWEKLRGIGKSNQDARSKVWEHAGVALMLSKRMGKYRITTDPEGSRLMRLRLRFRKEIDFLVAYGQQANKSPKETDTFYK